ncbi:uncharacterized protein LOC143436224 [Arvicanthis niloticus]|uniref:uncharacterized protein LOC143310138 n=1 Tax=Arvicanthis niloticus TaxID=61156 RepID=UPI00402B2DA6
MSGPSSSNSRRRTCPNLTRPTGRAESTWRSPVPPFPEAECGRDRKQAPVTSPTPAVSPARPRSRPPPPGRGACRETPALFPSLHPPVTLSRACAVLTETSRHFPPPSTRPDKDIRVPSTGKRSPSLAPRDPREPSRAASRPRRTREGGHDPDSPPPSPAQSIALELVPATPRASSDPSQGARRPGGQGLSGHLAREFERSDRSPGRRTRPLLGYPGFGGPVNKAEFCDERPLPTAD